MDVLRKLLAEDGARGLYKGAVPVLLRLNIYKRFTFTNLKAHNFSSSAGRTCFFFFLSIVFQKNWVLLQALFNWNRLIYFLWTQYSKLSQSKKINLKHLLKEVFFNLLELSKLLKLSFRAFPANAFCFLGFECAMYSLNSIAPNLWL